MHSLRSCFSCYFNDCPFLYFLKFNIHMRAILGTVDVLILCGGLGSRLKSVNPDRPKSLAPIGGKPFLDILVEDLVKQGFQRIIFCVGHLKEQIIDRYKPRKDAEYLFSKEYSPLGTGGAIQNALPLIHSNPVLIMNGDSFCYVDYAKFHQFHMDKSAAASLVLAAQHGRCDGGAVSLDEARQIQTFTEKSIEPTHERFINAGIYLLQVDSIDLHRPAPTYSLEYDVLPELVRTQPCFGFVVSSGLVDIGTPERYLRANSHTVNND